jgi:hypothetical protein
VPVFWIYPLRLSRLAGETAELARKRSIMSDWLKKFLFNRLLYMVLLLIVCTGIFPFVVLYALTSWIADSWDRVSPSSKLKVKSEKVWDIIGIPYDKLVKLVG